MKNQLADDLERAAAFAEKQPSKSTAVSAKILREAAKRLRAMPTIASDAELVKRLRANAQVCRDEELRVKAIAFKAELANNAREWDEAADRIEALTATPRPASLQEPGGIVYIPNKPWPGGEPASLQEPCNECDGSGRRRVMFSDIPNLGVDALCGACNGTGTQEPASSEGAE